MNSSREDRRKNRRQPAFPLTDSQGHTILCERRSGNDRRKKRRQQDVAIEILNILH